jgi:uncharacterized protein (TIGR02271 family)
MGVSTHSIEFNAPLRAVYNQWTQFEEFSRFMEGGGWRGQVGTGASPDLDDLPMPGSRVEGGAAPQVSERAANNPLPRTAGASTIEVPLSEEEVKVGKRTVGAGEVKLHKTVTTEQVNVPVELKREDIVIERVPDHQVESTGKETFQEEHIVVPLSREEPVVEKETRVTGVVRVRKTEGVEQQTIRESVRREDLDIDESGKTACKESGTREEQL